MIGVKLVWYFSRFPKRKGNSIITGSNEQVTPGAPSLLISREGMEKGEGGGKMGQGEGER